VEKLVKLAVTLILLAAAPLAAQDPARFEKELNAFAAADAAAPPPRGEIVFAGSSTVVDWDTAKHFPGLRIVKRGLWGSSLSDVTRLVDRLVLQYQPRLVVLYGGDNDIDGGRSSEDVAVQFERFVRTVHAKLPQTRIVFIGIKPSPQRWMTIDRMRTTNAMIRAICSRDDRLAFLDVDGVMLGWDERPRRDLYADDGLHLSAAGYELWSTLLRPFLLP
jgi:lysophospholipase L1-like esterase